MFESLAGTASVLEIEKCNTSIIQRRFERIKPNKRNYLYLYLGSNFLFEDTWKQTS